MIRSENDDQVKSEALSNESLCKQNVKLMQRN